MRRAFRFQEFWVQARRRGARCGACAAYPALAGVPKAWALALHRAGRHFLADLASPLLYEHWMQGNGVQS
jgi:hypothetical protein